MRVFVTDGENRATLAVVRSLGARGHEVTVGASSHPCIAGVSRHSTHRVCYPDPRSDSSGFIETILDEVRSRGVDVILPATDITTMLLARHRNDLPGHCALPLPSLKHLELAADKRATLEIACELGIQTPETIILESKSDAVRIPDDFYPCIVKGARSRVEVPGGWISTGTNYAGNRDEMAGLLEGKDSREYPLLIQRRIFGAGVGAFFCFQEGAPIAHFAHRRIREKPPSGGVSVLRESVPLSPELRDQSEALLSYLKWHGVAMVEFKVDDRSGIPVLMEINGRFWGSLQLAIDSGVDFPNVLLGTLNPDCERLSDNYQIGVRTRWLWGDIDSLILVLLKGRRALKLTDGDAGRWSYLQDFLRVRGTPRACEVLRKDDPVPWLHETWQWARRLLRGAGGRS